jgi:surface protein
MSLPIPTLSNFNVSDAYYGDGSFSLIDPSTNSTGTFTYGIDPSDIADISGNIVTIKSVGSATITATQAATEEYDSGTIDASFVVYKGNPLLSNFNIQTATYGVDTSVSLIDPSTNSTGTFTYGIDNSNLADISGSIVTIKSAGSATITATQIETDEYNSAEIDASFVVNKGDPGLSNFNNIVKNYGDSPFNNITNPSSNSDGSFNYSIIDGSNVATVSDNTVTIVGAGNTTIRATQLSTTNYNEFAIDASLIILKSTPAITNNTPSYSKVYGEPDFNISNPSSNSDGSFSYTIDASNIATVSGNTVSIAGVGNATITGSQDATANYEEGTFTISLTVNKGITTLNNFIIPDQVYNADPYPLQPPQSNRSGEFYYSTDASNVVDVSENFLIINGGGNVTITATQSATDNYYQGVITTSFTVNPIDPSLNNFNTITKNYGDNSFNIIDPSTNSTGTFTYSIDASNIATISGNTITIVGGGSATIRATQLATANYKSLSIDASLIVNPIDPSYNFTTITQNYADVSFTIIDPSSNSTGKFTYSIDGSNIADISGNIVIIKNAGTSKITATQEATPNYNLFSVDASLVINKALPILSNFTIPIKNYQGASFTIDDPTSDSSGSFSYSTDASNIADISGNVITIVGGGTAKITATQAESENYTSGTIDASFTVNPIDPSLNNFNITSQTYSRDASFTIDAPSSDSSGSFSYSTDASNIADISGNVITIVGAGTAIITATQAATANYKTSSIDSSFVVYKAIPQLSNFNIPSENYGDASFTIVDPSSNSSGSFTYTTDASNIATISGKIVTITGVGTAKITATQQETENYISGTIDASFTVNPATRMKFNIIATNTTVKIPLSGSGLAVTVDWDDGVVNNLLEHTYTALGIYNVALNINSGNANLTLGGTNEWNANNTLTEVTTFGDLNLVSLKNAFKNCTNLIAVPYTIPSGITDMNSTFMNASSFNSDINNWDTSSVTNMESMFNGSSVFNKNIGNWDTSSVTNMKSMFTNANLFNQNITNNGNKWNTVNVVDMGAMFEGASAFNGNIGNWDTSKVTDMHSMFYSASAFNQDISTWNIENVTLTNAMFYGASTFNQPIGTWDTRKITNMNSMFYGASAFNQNITKNGNSWNTSEVTNMGFMFHGASTFDQNIGNWNTNKVTSMQSMFHNASTFNQNIGSWDVSKVTNMTGFLTGNSTMTLENFNYLLNGWSTETVVSNVTLDAPSIQYNSDGETGYNILTHAPNNWTINAIRYEYFTLKFNVNSGTIINIPLSGNNLNVTVNWGDGTTNNSLTHTYNYANTYSVNLRVNSGNQNLTLGGNQTWGIPEALVEINDFGNLNLTSLQNAFTGCTNITVVPNSIPYNITNMSYMFNNAAAFNGSISTWNTSYVTDMDSLFKNALTFNKDISSWNTSNVTSMSFMFYGASAFNQSIGTWNTQYVTSMYYMFYGASAFDKDINNWNTAAVSNMSNMFRNASNFNKPIGNWNTSEATDMTNMFYGASAFNQAIGDWVTIKVSNMSNMFHGASAFNQNITKNGNKWNTLEVTNMDSMFYGATAFNQAIGNWDTSKVLNMSNMFREASAFNQAIGSWNVSNVTSMSGFLTDNSIMTVENFNNLLNGWASRSVQPYITLDSNSLQYNGYAENAYKKLTTSPNYWTITATATPKFHPILSNFNIIAKNYLAQPFQVFPPDSTNTDPYGVFTYTTGDINVATISGDIVTIVGAGTTLITARQSETFEYATGTIDASFTVNPIDPSYNFTTITKNYGDISFNITTPTSDSSGAFNYAIDASNVATVSGNIVSIVGAGTAKITATQEATTNYNALSIDASLIINPIAPSYYFTDITQSYADVSFTIIDPSSNSSGKFTYSTDASNIADISGSIVTIVGAGTAKITVTQEATINYTSRSIDASLVINKSDPYLSIFSIPSKNYGEASFDIIDPSSNSTGKFTYSIDASNIADISGNTITIVGGGTATITVKQAATNNYNEGIIPASFTVNPIDPSLNNFNTITKNYGDNSFNIIDPSTNSTGTFTYSIDASNIATISGNTITIVGGGSATIRATQLATANYKSLSIDASLIVNPIDPSYNFTTITQNYADVSFTIIDPSSNSTGKFTYSIDGSNIADISGNIVIIKNAGTSKITATQEATPNYNLFSVDASLVINKALPILSNFTIPIKNYQGASFTIDDPTSDSSGSFSYSTDASNIADISGNVINIVGAGTAKITATQAESENYTSGTIDASFTVNPIDPSLNNFNTITKNYREASFTIIDPSSDSSGSFSYSTDASNIADISGNVITIVGAGTAIITATQAATTNYNAVSIDASLIVNPIDPSLNNFNTITKNYREASFTIIDPSSDSSGSFTYSTDASNIADISGNVITIVGAGTAIIRATQAATTNYNALSIDASLIVNPIDPSYNFNTITKNYREASFAIIDPSSDSSGAFRYSIDASNVATVSGNVITIVGAGTAIIRATQAATTNYNALSIDASLIVNPIDPSYNFNTITKNYREASFAIIDPSSDSSGAFRYSIDASNVATVSGNVITIVGAGTAKIRATQEATTNYKSLAIDASLVINKASPLLSNFTIPTKRYKDASFQIIDPSSNSTGSFTYYTDASNIADISGNIIKILDAGTTIITATQSESANYTSGTIDASFTVNPINPSLNNFNTITKNYNDPSFNIIDPSSNSRGEFNYSIDASDVAVVSGKTITIIGVGNAKITATQVATRDYSSFSIDASLIVNPIDPSYNFSSIIKNYGDASFNIIDPSSDSSGSFTYSIDASNIADISGNTITIVGGGTTKITATQAATANYKSRSIDASLIVNPINPSLNNFNSIIKYYKDASFVIIDPSTNSTGTFTYSIDASNVATVSGNVITIVGGGRTIIRATQAATANYNSFQIDASLIVKPISPILNNFNTITKNYGDLSFTIIAPSSDSSSSFTYSTDASSVVDISGNIVTIVGAGTAKITATQAENEYYISGSIDASLIVNPIDPSLNIFNIPYKYYGDASFDITDPSSNSTGAFSYRTDASNIADISGNTINIVGAGYATIYATQAATVNYNSKTINTSFTVLKKNPTISNFNNITKNYGDLSFNIIDPSSNSTGSYTYTTDASNVADISENTITIVGGGSARITATQTETNNYNSGSTYAFLTVNPIDPVLNNFNNITKNYADISFTVIDPSSNSSGSFTYTVDASNVATVSGKTINIVGAGTAKITATQLATNNHKSLSIDASLVIDKANPLLRNFTVATKNYKDASFAIINPSSNSTGSFTYTTDSSNIVDISQNIINVVNVGTAIIRATQSETANYISSTIDASFTVNPIDPSYMFNNITKNYKDPSFNITDPISDSSGAFTYAIDDSNVATVSGKTVTIIGAGTATLRATQSATNNYNSRFVDASLIVNKINPVLTNFNIPIMKYGDMWFVVVNPTSTNKESTGTFSYSSSDQNVAKIYGNDVTIIGGGTTVITATQASTNNYNSVSIDASLVIDPVNATMHLDNIVKIYNDPDFILNPVSNSDGNFSYSSSNTNVATINGNKVSIVGIGEAIITATQVSTNNYTSGTVNCKLTVLKSRPSISINNITAYYGDYPIRLNPTSNSNGDFTYYSDNGKVATTQGNIITIVGAGIANITVYQSATNNYTTGEVIITLTVNRIDPTIVFNDVIKFYDDSDFMLKPVSNSNGLFNYSISNTNVASISGNYVHINGLGDAIITATQEATTNYNSISKTVQLSVVTMKYPNLTNFDQITKKYGESAFEIIPPDTDSNGQFNYSSSNSSVASVSGNIVSIHNLGTTTITAIQQGTDRYYQASINTTLTVNKMNSFVFKYQDVMQFSTTQDAIYKPTIFNAQSSEIITYRTTTQLPDGITFNKLTGEISGKPLSPFGQLIITVCSDSIHYAPYREQITLICNQ